jgi:hypothetical protein
MTSNIDSFVIRVCLSRCVCEALPEWMASPQHHGYLTRLTGVSYFGVPALRHCSCPHRLQDHLNNLHRYPPLSLTTIIKTMEARLLPENRASKCHRGRWPMLKSQTTEMLVVLVLHWVNWRAQGNNCDHYYVSQGGEHGIPLSFCRHHIRICRHAILHLAACGRRVSLTPILSRVQTRLIFLRARRRIIAALCGPLF